MTQRPQIIELWSSGTIHGGYHAFTFATCISGPNSPAFHAATSLTHRHSILKPIIGLFQHTSKRSAKRGALVVQGYLRSGNQPKACPSRWNLKCSPKSYHFLPQYDSMPLNSNAIKCRVTAEKALLFECFASGSVNLEQPGGQEVAGSNPVFPILL